MVIQIDTREKQRAITNIKKTFDQNGVLYYSSKLVVGDYMNLDNPRVIVDRKQNLGEVAQNVCQQHDRFRREMLKANQLGIKLVFLVEHGGNIESLEDVIFWQNPRGKVRTKSEDGKWTERKTKAITGQHLYSIMKTMEIKYVVEWVFCNKASTGRKIIEILGGEVDGSRRN